MSKEVENRLEGQPKLKPKEEKQRTMKNFPIPLPFTINITQRFIDIGVKGDCYRCPTSIAILSLSPDLKERDVDVEAERILIYRRPEGKWAEAQCWKIKPPEELTKWINDFDLNCDPGYISKPIKTEITEDMIEEL